ncbi:MAG: hypothetical protein WC067_04805 [Candidatus Methanomethylophilaceae archaeon]
MGLTIVKGRKGSTWIDESLPKGLDLMTTYHRTVFWVFIFSLVACVILAGAIVLYTGYTIVDVAILISAPFLVVGIMVYLHSGRWYYFIVIAAVSALLYFLLNVGPIYIFLIDFTLVGSVGVVAVVVIIQRFLFYRIVHMVEYLNVKDKMTLWERTVAFMFNIPRDLDTRNLVMEYNMKRTSIPWNEVKETLSLALMIGIFIWIYLCMNPAFMTFNTFLEAPLYIFSLVLYIPIIAMPWSIFRSLDVRIETKYRDFTLYSGIKETLKRMVIPIFATFMFILLAVNQNGYAAVLGFILLSIVMNVFIIGLTSIVYYAFFEDKLIDDVVSRWKVFRPVELAMNIGNGIVEKAKLPCTPERDTEDFGELVFTQ